MAPLSARCSAAASGRMRPIPSCGLRRTRLISKDAAKLDIQVILEPTDRSINQGLRFIALVYLCIGIYVLFRRWTAPKSTHFYVFCLVSFVLYSFKYTTELDTFDWIIYWGNIAAAALQPALFLHFAVSFSDDYASSAPAGSVDSFSCVALYLPGIFLIGLQVWAIQYWSATEVLRHRLDQISVGYLALYYVIAAIVFQFRYRQCGVRLWSVSSSSGLPAARCSPIAPFTLLYVIPYLADIHGSKPADEVRRSLAGLPAADLQLGHRPLPADGRRPHLQARRHLHARDRRAGRPLLRRRRRHGRDGPHPPAEPAHLGPPGRHHHHRPDLRPSQARDPGPRRSRLRSEALRLPRDPGRVRPRPQLADRPARPARLHRRAAAADTAGHPRRCLPGDESDEHDQVQLSDFELAASHGLTNLQPADLRSARCPLPRLRPAGCQQPSLPREPAAGPAPARVATPERRAARPELLPSLPRRQSRRRLARALSRSSAWAAPTMATSSPAKTWSCSSRWPATSASRSRTRSSIAAWSRRSPSSSA